MHFHWQNLNDDENGNPRGFPWSGRAHIRPGDGDVRPAARVEWALGGHHLGLSLRFDPDDVEVQLFVGLPRANFWLSLAETRTSSTANLWKRLKSEREVGFSIHDGALWVSVWENRNNWSSRDPWWMHFTIRPANVLGKQTFSQRVIEEREVEIPMPEGTYKAKAMLVERERGRSRWPWKRRSRGARFDLREKPIPFSGKGENDYDCGEDGLYGMSCPAESISDGIGKVVASCLETRARRGDPARWPVAPAAVVEEAR